MNSEPLEISDETKEMVDRIMVDRKALFVMGLEDVVCYDVEKLMIMTPLDLLKEIDKASKLVIQYTGSRRRKLSDVQWDEMWIDVEIEYGGWSNALNKIIRHQLKETTSQMGIEKDPDKKEMNLTLHNKFSWVNAYWWNRFHWISKVCRSKSGLGGMTVKKGLKSGQDALSKLIRDIVGPEKIHPAFHKVIQNLKIASVDAEVKDTLDNM